MQPAAVHKLHPLAEFAFLKALQIRHLKMLVCHTEVLNAVYSVDGRKQIIRIFKLCFPVNIPDESDKVEVVFGEHQADRLDHPLNGFSAFELFIGDLCHQMPLDGVSELPKTV